MVVELRAHEILDFLVVGEWKLVKVVAL